MNNETVYEMQLLIPAPTPIPRHKLVIFTENGVEKGKFITEFCEQEAKGLVITPMHIRWDVVAGKNNDEPYHYEMTRFPGDTLLGTAWGLKPDPEQILRWPAMGMKL